jgi:hypothetical protein
VSLNLFTAESQKERQGIAIAASILSLITLLIPMTSGPDLMVYKFSFFFGCFAAWPSLISFFVNQNKIANPISRSKTSFSVIISFVLFLILFLYQILKLGKVSLDEKLIFSINYIPIIPTFILIIIKKTVFHKNGIFHDGALWSWEDFKEYEWSNNKSNNNEKLILKTKSLLINGKITMNIAPKEKNVIEELLSKNIISSP